MCLHILVLSFYFFIFLLLPSFFNSWLLFLLFFVVSSFCFPYFFVFSFFILFSSFSSCSSSFVVFLFFFVFLLSLSQKRGTRRWEEKPAPPLGKLAEKITFDQALLFNVIFPFYLVIFFLLLPPFLSFFLFLSPCFSSSYFLLHLSMHHIVFVFPCFSSPCRAKQHQKNQKNGAGRRKNRISPGEMRCQTAFFSEAAVPPRRAIPEKATNATSFGGLRNWTSLVRAFRGAILDLFFSFRITFSQVSCDWGKNWGS